MFQPVGFARGFQGRAQAEGRRGRNGGATLGNFLQPAQGILKEARGIHQERAAALEEGRQSVSDETHVVVEGQPAHDARRAPHVVIALDDFLIVMEIRVGDHHAPGAARGAGGIL